jgi:predicted DNA binding CopG/RHH family protein
MTAPAEFSSMKIKRSLLRQLKIEAARQGIPIYELIERLVANGLPTVQ